MKKILALSVLAIFAVAAVSSSEASADRGRGHWKKHHRGASWSGGILVTPAPRVIAPRVRYERPRRVYVQRRPIYVQRPLIKYRYYNYYQRPALIVENHPPRAGYYWVSGSWQWNGVEWIWSAGYYAPDPSYVEPSYDNNYDYDYDYSYNYDGYGTQVDVHAHVHSHGCGHH